VRWGDTIGNIAWRYGVNSTYLSRANGLRNPNRIYAGQYLWIPCYCRR
jgi:LysM repeat protein